MKDTHDKPFSLGPQNKKESISKEYISNPFKLTFKGFDLLLEFARGVFIIMLIFSSIGLLSNIPEFIPSDNSSISYNDTTEEFQLQFIDDFSDDNSTTISRSYDTNEIASFIAIVLILFITFILIAIAVSAIYKGFIAAAVMVALESQHISIKQAFRNMKGRFRVLFVAEFLAGIRILGGYLLFIIPGIRAQLRYNALPYIIMSELHLGASDAIKRAKFLYKNHLLESFGISTVGAIVPFVGSSLSSAGYGMSVKQLSKFKDNNLKTPPAHWLNYLGIIIGAFFLLFFILFIALLIIAIG